MKPFFFLNDITRNTKESEPTGCEGPWPSSSNVAPALQLCCACVCVRACTGSVYCLLHLPVSLHAASASSRLCDEPAHNTMTWDKPSFHSWFPFSKLSFLKHACSIWIHNIHIYFSKNTDQILKTGKLKNAHYIIIYKCGDMQTPNTELYDLWC